MGLLIASWEAMVLIRMASYFELKPSVPCPVATEKGRTSSSQARLRVREVWIFVRRFVSVWVGVYGCGVLL